MAAVIRNAIERMFCRLKDFRRGVATRYGRKLSLGFASLLPSVIGYECGR
jgi:hypothetical protein